MTASPSPPSIPDFEACLQRLYERLLAPGDIAIDAGAHTGRHALPMARRVHPGGRVHAFEPLPFCRAELLRAIGTETPGLRSTLVVHPEALGERDDEADFVVAVDLPGYSGLRPRTYDAPTRIERLPVPVRRLDGLLADLTALTYIKIDVEGGELGVLRGATELIGRFRPVVSFEFGLAAIGHYSITPADMARFWAERDYRLFDVLGRELPTEEGFIESATRQEVWDYVALPRRRPELVPRLLPPSQK